ncbi:MAG: hypothetical protein K9J13_15915 [Saprospiraceae bacterium]|nr:hypothetical protein [Saprospiraceae bacterium]
MKKFVKYLSFVLLILILTASSADFCYSQVDQATIDANKKENEKCFKCHGDRKYSYFNDEIGREIKKSMYQELIINPEAFYASNHKTFKCISCHSEDYTTFPHSGELRMEEKYACLDCHGGDEAWAMYKFEEIEEEFAKSIHSTKHDEAFSCWMCHDPHEYHISARTEDIISNTISYDNAICLSCHANIDKYQLLTEKENPNIIDKHEWLPNQALHFRNVRCIECHAQINDSMLVSHNIMSKDHAVKNCVACHSSNSRLMTSLYKHNIIEGRNKFGFVNSVILNDAYVIGANRNYYLNVISILGFIIAFAGVMLHGVLRMIFIKK